MDPSYGLHDLRRDEFVALLLQGHSVARVAQLLSLGRSTAYRWAKLYKEEGVI